MKAGAGLLVVLAAAVLFAAAPAPRAPQGVGFPSRDPNLDALPGFVNPPPGYGEVAFYWWMGDPLTKERLAWQLDQLAGRGVTGLQINYAHSDQGGRAWGLTYPSDPPLFSPPWWDLAGWFLKEAKQHGMSVSLSDYTLGIGQGSVIDEILREHPELTGSVLRHETKETTGGNVAWTVPAGTLSVSAYDTELRSLTDVTGRVRDGRLSWQAPAGRYRLVAVFAERVVPSIDPMNPLTGSEYVRKFFGRWEDHNPGEAGRGLDFFFSDELDFGVTGNLWTSRFAWEFRRRKGYDLLPVLAALFEDIGPRTPKVRLDYRDVMVSLEEEAFFKPVFDWHQQRGMIFGCDHGGRGRDVTEFGDYFRTQRWNQGPGSDQPNLSKDVIKAKVASSIAHLYERPRAWVEGYHSSGWGTTTAQLADATFANFAAGYNLLTLHGLYYSTHGGWWEWAPPSNHQQMPYWPHMATFLKAVERLSYLLSQGVHRCDVAVLYPVAAVEAGTDGETAVRAAFDTGRRLYDRGIDFDFMDFQSLARATIVGRELHVAGEAYRALVLPAMKAVRFSTLLKAVEFERAGGVVILLGAEPEATDRAGRNDPEVAALAAELRTRVETAAEVEGVLEDSLRRDYSGPGAVLHRRVGPRDVYLVYGAPEGSECSFRATGNAELWDPWTGRTSTLPVVQQARGMTRLRMPLSEHDPQLIVFSPPALATAKSAVAATDDAATQVVALDGDWEFELAPVLDNRWGDFEWPPSRTLVGAEARRLRYAAETEAGARWQDPSLDDSQWPRVTATFGPKFWKLGPVPDEFDGSELARLRSIDPAVPVEFGKSYRWQPYEFSWRWGIEGDPGRQGYHGLKEHVPDEFLAVGRVKLTNTGSEYEREEGGGRYFFWTSAFAEQAGPARLSVGGNRPAAIWLDGVRLPGAGVVDVRAGSNPLVIRYDQPGRGYAVIGPADPPGALDPPSWNPLVFAVSPLAMHWFNRPGILRFDVYAGARPPAGWYRFLSPPGLRSMSIRSRGSVRAWVDGDELRAEGGTFSVPRPAASPVRVAIRIEPERGSYGGAALDEPIRLECVPGRLPAGDWSLNDGLASYSGGAWYRKTVRIPAAGRVILDLGNVVSTAEVRVNGRAAATKVAPPWTIDISALARPGDNRLEILVYNTLSNHYSTIPTRYRGQPTSGLLGPVTLSVRESK